MLWRRCQKEGPAFGLERIDFDKINGDQAIDNAIAFAFDLESVRCHAKRDRTAQHFLAENVLGENVDVARLQLVPDDVCALVRTDRPPAPGDEPILFEQSDRDVDDVK